MSRRKSDGPSRGRLPQSAGEEPQFQAFLNSAPDAMVIVDGGGRITIINAQAEKLFGYTSREMIGQPLSILVPERFRDTHARQQAEYMGRPNVRPMGAARDISARRKDGSEFAADISLSPIKTRGGILICSAIRDITERHRAERRLAGQYAVTQILAESATLEEAAPKLLQALCESLEWSFGALWNIDDSAGVLRCRSEWHRPGLPLDEFLAVCRQITFTPNVGLPGRVWASKEPVWIQDVAREGNFPRLRYATSAGLHAALGFPIVLEGKVIGVIEFLCREFRRPDDELIRMFASMGSQIGQFASRKVAEQTLRESEERLRSLMACAPDAIISFDSEGRIVSCNDAAEELFGYMESQLLQRPLSFLMADSRAEKPLFGKSALSVDVVRLAGRTVELEGLRSGEKRFPTEVSVSSWKVGGKPFYTAIIRDITERKNVERMKSEMLALASHELRTPLSVIIGSLGAALESGLDGLPSSARQLLELALRNGRHLLTIINSYLNLTSIERGETALDARDLDLSVILADAVQAMRHYVAEKRLSFKLVGAEGPAMVRADPVWLRQVIDNLLSNAAKFSPEEGVVAVRLFRRKGDYRIAVRDRGPGIRKEFQPKIFQKFVQDRSNQGKLRGTGLGLSIAKALVERMGGSLWFATKEGAGSIFFVRLPTLPASDPSGAESA